MLHAVLGYTKWFKKVSSIGNVLCGFWFSLGESAVG